MNVLVVEDDTITQMYLEHMLLNDGHKIVGFAASGELAIEKAEKDKPDIILMDIELEGDMNGIDAADHIRKQTDIPVVFITGNSDRVKSDERMQSIKPLAVLIKPVMNGDLTNILNQDNES